LVDIADGRATQLRAAKVVEATGLDPDDLDLARLRRFEQPAEMEQCRLACARGGDQGDEFTAFDHHIGGLEHAIHAFALAIMAMDTGEAQVGITHSAAPRLDHIERHATPDRASPGSSAPAPTPPPR